MTPPSTPPTAPSTAAASRRPLVPRWLRAQWPFTLVVAIIVAMLGYLVLFPGHWRRASAVLSIALLLAGVLRAVLPRTRAGMLVVRARWFDIGMYLVLGAVVLAVAIRLH